MLVLCCALALQIFGPTINFHAARRRRRRRLVVLENACVLLIAIVHTNYQPIVVLLGTFFIMKVIRHTFNENHYRHATARIGGNSTRGRVKQVIIDTWANRCAI